MSRRSNGDFFELSLNCTLFRNRKLERFNGEFVEPRARAPGARSIIIIVSSEQATRRGFGVPISHRPPQSPPNLRCSFIIRYTSSTYLLIIFSSQFRIIGVLLLQVFEKQLKCIVAKEREVIAVLRLLSHTVKTFPGIFNHGQASAVVPVIGRILPFFAEPAYRSVARFLDIFIGFWFNSG